MSLGHGRPNSEIRVNQEIAAVVRVSPEVSLNQNIFPVVLVGSVE